MSNLNQQMIFITGASRSGTTLLSFVLRNHNRILGLKELQFFGEFWDPRKPQQQLSNKQLIDAAAAILARQSRGILDAKPTEEETASARSLVAELDDGPLKPAELFASALKRLSEAAGGAIPCEQTPRNIFYADSLLRTYPAAHVVHMMRDPRAVTASQKKRWRRRQLAQDRSRVPLRHSLRVWVNYHPFTIARLWNRSSCEANRLRNHPRFTLLRFEDLLEKPEQTISRLCSRLGIDYEPAMLDVGQINSSHQTSVGGARKGLNTAAIDVWKQTLSEPETAIVEKFCMPAMETHGYQPVAKSRSLFSWLWFGFTYFFHILGVILLNPKRGWIQFRALLQPADNGGTEVHERAVKKPVAVEHGPTDIATGEQR